MRLAAILFDIDGTLVDSNDIHTRCWIEAFEHFGKELEWDVVSHQIGKGGDLLVPDLLNARQMRDFGDKVKKYRGDLYKKKYMDTVMPFPRVKESLQRIHDLGVKLVLASSGNPDEVKYYTKLLDVADLIEGSTSKKDAKFSKPSPEIFEAALEQAGSDPEFTLVVGDTPYDILAAHRSRVACRGGSVRRLRARAAREGRIPLRPCRRAGEENRSSR